MSTPERTTNAHGLETSDARPFRLAEGAMLVLFGVLLLRNAFAYPAIAGVDAIEHRTRAWDLVVNGRLDTTGSYYTPPGWYAIAGELLKLGDRFDLAMPERPVQVLSALFVLASGILLVLVAGRAFPGRRWLRLWSLAAFCACPAVVKPAAMVHPQPLVLFLTALGLLALVELLGRSRWPVWLPVGLGLVLGGAQLVRSVGLWIYAVAAVSLVLAVVVASPRSRRRIAALATTTLAIGALVPLPWYAYLQVEYGDPVFGGRPEIARGMPEQRPVLRTLASTVEKPRIARAPLSFFTATGLPRSITHPYRGGAEPTFFPILLSDTWGDYFGQWSWGIPDAALDPPDRARLATQALVGLPLTFIAFTGLVALLVLVARSPRRRLRQLPLAALPPVALAALAFYAWRYPSTDGDTVKSLFLLPAAPAFATSFGFAVDVAARRLPDWARVALGTALAALLAVCVQFGIA